MTANVFQETNSLSRNQKRVIAALLEYKSILDAATATGLSEKTVQRYLALPAFRLALARAEDSIVEQAGRRLLGSGHKALKVLEDLMENAEKQSDQRLAAQAWLDFVLRWRELKIEERLTALEEMIYGK